MEYQLCGLRRKSPCKIFTKNWKVPIKIRYKFTGSPEKKQNKRTKNKTKKEKKKGRKKEEENPQIVNRQSPSHLRRSGSGNFVVEQHAVLLVHVQELMVW